MSYELQKYTVAELAEMVGCNRPATPTSAGAHFLLGIYSNVQERIEEDYDGDENSVLDFVGEMADSAIPIYYVEQIELILDLHLWHARVDELGECETLANAMTAAIYDTANSLVFALVRKVVQHEDAPW